MSVNHSLPMELRACTTCARPQGEVNRRTMSVVLAATVGQLTSPAGILNACMGLFLIPLTTTFHWSRTEFSIAFMLHAWVMAFLFPLTGWLMDRYGVRRVLLPGMFLLVVAFIALALQPGALWIFYAIFVLVGFCAASTGPVPCAKVISGWFHERRGTMLALSGLGVALAAIVLPIFVQTTMSRWGWRSGFMGLAALIAIVGLPTLLLLLKESPLVIEARRQRTNPEVVNAQAESALGVATKEAIRTSPFWLCLVAVGLSVLVSSSLLSHAVALLGGRGVSPAQALSFVSLAGAGMGAVRLFEGFLLDAINSPKLGIPFALLCLAGLLLLQYGSSVPVYMLAGLLFGMGVGGETSFVPYAMSRFFGIRCLAQIYGLGWACAAVAAGLGPVLMGVLYDRTGSYAIGLAVAEGAIVISAISFFIMPGYRFTAKPRAANAKTQADIK